MVIRQITPTDGSVDLPINTEVFVAVIGDGDATHFELTLMESVGGKIVEGSLETACYLHEAHTEYHCNFAFTPTELLEEQTEYQLILNGTELHAEDSFSYTTFFTTGIDYWEPNEGAPDLTIKSYIARPAETLDPCDWQQAMKYELEADLVRFEDRQILLHVYEVDPQTCEESIVHTLFPRSWLSTFSFRQVLTPGTEGPRCYRAEQEDWAGHVSASSQTMCWNPAEQQEELFTACDPPDTATQSEDTATDTTPYTDSGLSQNPSSDPDSSTVKQEDNGSCSGSSSILLLPLLLLSAQRRIGSPTEL